MSYRKKIPSRDEKVYVVIVSPYTSVHITNAKKNNVICFELYLHPLAKNK